MEPKKLEMDLLSNPLPIFFVTIYEFICMHFQIILEEFLILFVKCFKKENICHFIIHYLKVNEIYNERNIIL